MYASGADVAANRDEAVRWLRKAADAGHAHARHDLAVLTAAEGV